MEIKNEHELHRKLRIFLLGFIAANILMLCAFLPQKWKEVAAEQAEHPLTFIQDCGKC